MVGYTVMLLHADDRRATGLEKDAFRRAMCAFAGGLGRNVDVDLHPADDVAVELTLLTSDEAEGDWFGAVADQIAQAYGLGFAGLGLPTSSGEKKGS